MNMNAKNFVDSTLIEMEQKGVKVNLDEANPYVLLNGNLQCNGYFTDHPELVFACGAGKDFDRWFPIYVHEYGHFTQWRDNIPEWTNVWVDGLYYDNFLEQWLGYRQMRFAPWKVAKFIQAGIALEADCERRVIKLIQEHDLPIYAPIYAQKANAYVHFYNYIEANRKWYEVGREPYNLPEVWQHFNTTIDDDFSSNEKYMELYAKYCFA